MNQKNILTAIVLAIVVAGGAFYGGVTYAKSKATSGRALGANFQMMQNGGLSGRGMRGANGGFAGGEILSLDDKSITVKLQNGGSKIVFLSDTTTIGKTVDATKSDLAIGKQVVVNGTTNSDGSITAQNIQIRPATTTPTK